MDINFLTACDPDFNVYVAETIFVKILIFYPFRVPALTLKKVQRRLPITVTPKITKNYP